LILAQSLFHGSLSIAFLIGRDSWIADPNYFVFRAVNETLHALTRRRKLQFCSTVDFFQIRPDSKNYHAGLELKIKIESDENQRKKADKNFKISILISINFSSLKKFSYSKVMRRKKLLTEKKVHFDKKAQSCPSFMEQKGFLKGTSS